MVSCDHHARPRMSHDTYNQGLRRFWRRSVQRGGSNNAESRVLGSRRCCEPGDEGTINHDRRHVALSAPSFAARSRVFTRNGEDASSGGYKFVRGASPQVFAWLPRRVPASAKVQDKYRLQGTKMGSDRLQLAALRDRDLATPVAAAGAAARSSTAHVSVGVCAHQRAALGCAPRCHGPHGRVESRCVAVDVAFLDGAGVATEGALPTPLA